ncbi:MAG TPA: Rieske 2Fe-2S domain-containing protein [Terriglobales bacterium]|nr:Rieske 2Fe-2S domain-containing protein [Terriglobales bacterium]
MLTQEENDLLTQTGPGTPAGALLRRYWQPVALAEELPPDASPLPVRVLSEDLVLFRDDQGQLGLIGLHCSHRRADLSYGRVENGGLRCLYHGWLFDRYGNCLEQPCEPEGKKFCQKVRHPAYPCQEHAGIIFAYLGPGEPPLFPAYEPFIAPPDHVLVTKIYHECNYFQANEGNLDPSHVSFLHRQDNVPENLKRTVKGTDGKLPLALYAADLAPEIEADETDYGVRIFSIRHPAESRTFFRVTNFILPNMATIPGPMSGDGYNLYWHVPIDDTHHWRYDIVFRRSAPMDEKDIQRNQEILDELGAGYRPKRNKANRYLQDRESMKTWSFAGMGRIFNVQDTAVVEGSGAIVDRTQEFLGPCDRAIIVARRQVLRAIRDVQAGREAPNVVRNPTANHYPHLMVVSEVIEGTEWRPHWQDKLAALR